MIIKRLGEHIINAEVFSGKWKGKQVMIPRITMETSTDLPFNMSRKQLPLRLAFAITINKSQGQTMDRVAIYLPEPVFSHGQLYVAFSRVRAKQDVKVLIKNTSKQYFKDGKNYTINVVYKSIFQD